MNHDEVLTAKNVSKNISVESHFINPTSLKYEISMKRNRYVSTYRTEPHYIKLPMWVFTWACRFMSEYIRNNSDMAEVLLFNLVCCPTPSISELNEIEVF